MGIHSLIAERHIITMKLLVVVLALASLALAEPEADPAYLYSGYYGYPTAYTPSGSGYGYYNGYYGRSAYSYGVPNGYTHVDRLHKREVDAQVAVAPAATTPFVYNPLAYGLGLPALHTPVTATVTNVAAAPIAATLPAVASPFYGYGFPTAAAAYPGSLVYNTAPVATAPVAVAAPVVPHRPFTPYDCVTADGCAVRALKEAGLAKREAVAEPVAEADADAEAEAYWYGYYGNRYPGIYNNYYGAYGYNGFYGGYGYPYAYPTAAAPAAVVEPAVEVKAVEEPVVAAAPVPVAKTVVQKPVTYTHLGAHPIQPTTVLETT